MRQAHQLVKLKTNSRPDKIIFVDTESDLTPITPFDTQHKLRLGVGVFCRRRGNKTLKAESEIVFHTQAEFWNWLTPRLSKNTKMLFVAHNLSYDLPILHAFPILNQLGYKLTSQYIKGVIAIITFEKYYPEKIVHDLWLATNGKEGKKPPVSKLTMLDNMNFFADKLAVWGKKLNLPKLAVDFKGDEQQLITYCRRDVDIMIALWNNWFEFLDDNNCGKFCNTVSATAFTSFRTSYMRHDIYIHDHKPTLELERASYKGGRTEVFFKGEIENKTIYALDINSMYPSVMMNETYPVNLWRMVENPTWKHFIENLYNYSMIADVDIDIKRPRFQHKINIDTVQAGLSGWDKLGNNRDSTKLKTCYPLGRIRTTLTTPELKSAVENNEIVRVHAMSYYKEHKIFTDYVSHFHDLRLSYAREDNQLMAKLCKLLLVSLYGKFGQRGYETRILGYCEFWDFSQITNYDIDNQKLTEETRVGGTHFEVTRAAEHYHSFPAIAAHVTAFARLELFRLMEIAGLKHVLYCDTDSLFVDVEGYERLKHLIHPTELGKLKLEATMEDLIIHAPKDYEASNKLARKGVKLNATQIDTDTFVQERWPKLRGLWRDGEIDNYVTSMALKTLSRQIYSGVVSSSGWVYPYQMRDF